MMIEQQTLYVDHEGRDAMVLCINRAFEWCAAENITKAVIFTGTGEGPQYAAKELLPQKQFQHIQLTAVTPPAGKPYRTNPIDPNSPIVRAGISPEVREDLEALGVTVVSAHLPFKEILTGRGPISEWARIAEAFGVLGGGFSLCIQAVLMACDAGAISRGDRVVVASADTAFVANACRTDSFLSPIDGILVEHILCRPSRYQLSKPQHYKFQAPGLPAASIPALPSVKKRTRKKKRTGR